MQVSKVSTAIRAIGEAAIAAEERADFWSQDGGHPGNALSARHDADRLWDSALRHIGDDGAQWDRRQK